MSWSNVELRSTLHSSGEVEIALVSTTVAAPGPHGVVVRIEAAPLNPSDIAPLLGGADPAAFIASPSGTAATAPVSPGVVRAFAGRVYEPLVIGLEGAGVVVAAGSSVAAQRLLGKTVAIFGSGLHARYRSIEASACYALPDGVTPADGASFFVNPLTALGLVETARRDGFTALVQTAAASNLGQMIVKLCLEEGIQLVNIVRNADQADLLRRIGGTYICDSSHPSFDDDLLRAMTETGATAAFDAIGGGDMASRLLVTMEKVAVARLARYDRYGSTTRKHVYIYGTLDRRPTELRRAYGSGWSVGGWLLMPFLAQIGEVAANALHARVAAKLTTTFASAYSHTIGLDELIQPKMIAAFSKRATGEKFLVAPWQNAK